ncbi:MAG: FimV/HubP family polar landmark protein, partial [Pseudomonadales bacterium]
TRRNDTLWKLALQVRPSANVAPQKVMVAMQALNPDAFIDNNINLLKTGAVLRVPTLEDIERIDNDRARIAVAEQNERWRSATGQRQLDATPTRSTPEIVEESDSGSLRLTTSTSDDATGSGGTDGEAEGDGLGAKLLAAEEAVEKANAENIELRSKVEDLEAELLELKNKLEIRDSALANLQQAETKPAVADDKSEEAKADLAATKAAPEEAVAEPDPTTPAVAKSPGLLDTILDNPLYVGGLGALALALLGGLFVARRRGAADEGFDVMAEFEAEADAPLEEAAEQLESFTEAEAEDEFVEEPQDFSEFELDSLDNEEAVESEIGDPVAEADIYMAYGRFPQAVELLNRALEQEPERTDLRVKLVEVHMGAGAQDAAEEQLTQLQASGDDLAVEQAQALLGQDHETLDATIEQPELMDEFTQMLGENDVAEEFSSESEADPTLADAANEEFPGGLSLADDDDFTSDTLTAEDGLSLDDGFDLELDLDDAVVETDDAELDGLDLELPEGETNLDIESELSDLTSDLGMGDSELTVDESAKTVEFEPDLDLNVSDEDLAELEDNLVDQPPTDETHAELDLIDAADETATKIDLARAYIDMGDTEGAKDILSEVLDEAENEQLQEAQELLDRIA